MSDKLKKLISRAVIMREITYYTYKCNFIHFYYSLLVIISLPWQDSLDSLYIIIVKIVYLMFTSFKLK